MPVSAGIYQGQDQIGRNIVGGFQTGMSLMDMVQNKRKEKALQDVFKGAVVDGPDGPSINKPMLLSGLAKTDPKAFMDYQSTMAKQEISAQNAEIMKQLRLGQINELVRKGEFGPQKQQMLEEKHAAGLAKMQADTAYKRKQTRFVGKPKAGKGGGPGSYDIPGLTHDGVTKITPVDVRHTRQAVTQVSPLISNITKAQELIKNSKRSDWLDPGFRKTVNGYLRDAQLTYKSKDFANLGVLAGPDLDLLEEVLVNPFTIEGGYMGPDEVAESYSKAIQRIKEKTAANLAPYGYTAKDELYTGIGGKKGPSNKPDISKPKTKKPSWAK